MIGDIDLDLFPFFAVQVETTPARPDPKAFLRVSRNT